MESAKEAMNKVSEAAKQAYDSAAQTVTEAGNKMSETMTSAQNSASETAQQAQNRAGEAYDSAKAKVDETSQTAQHRAGEAWDNTKGQAQATGHSAQANLQAAQDKTAQAGHEAQARAQKAADDVLHAGSNSTNVDKNNTCDVNNIAGPDNLFYMNGNLLIAEDTSRHYNNVLWAHNLNTGVLSRILSSPTGAEVTGPRLSFAAGHAYITWAIQHPLEQEEGQQPADAEQEMEMRGYVGYLGPLPVEAVAPTSVLDFAPGAIPVASGAATVQVLGANRVCLV